MKRTISVLLITALLGAGVMLAQDDCGDGLPCGKIPWDLPKLPAVPSPTIIPTIPITLVPPTQTPGGPTATPAPTDAGPIDVSGINDQFATLQALAAATQPSIEVSGTPVNTDEQLATLTYNSGTFFGYVRGVSELNLGNLTPIFGFAIVSFLVVVGVKVITLILPVLAALFGLLRKVISVVLDFLPL
jgi:hypothetical protein